MPHAGWEMRLASPAPRLLPHLLDTTPASACLTPVQAGTALEAGTRRVSGTAPAAEAAERGAFAAPVRAPLGAPLAEPSPLGLMPEPSTTGGRRLRQVRGRRAGAPARQPDAQRWQPGGELRGPAAHASMTRARRLGTRPQENAGLIVFAPGVEQAAFVTPEGLAGRMP